MRKKLTKSLSYSASAQNSSPSSTSTPPSQPQNSDSNPATLSSLPTQPPTPFLTDGLPIPRLIIFDLDYTLWPFWIDTHVLPPLKPSPGTPTTSALDKRGESYAFYPDVPGMLAALAPQTFGSSSSKLPNNPILAGVKLALASRTHTPDLARELLKILHVSPPEGGGKAKKAEGFFSGGMEIYPGSKIRHMEALRKRTGVGFEEMVFFDDEERNREVEGLGVTFWCVRDGMSWGELERGVGEWRSRRGVRRGEIPGVG